MFGPLGHVIRLLLDIFLWGYIKSQVYVNKPRFVAEFQTEIRRLIDKINGGRVIVNFNDRIITCRNFGRGHIPHVIFHRKITTIVNVN